MTEQGSSDGFDRVGTTGADPDRAWWLEPDPVEVFAAGMELAIRQLHVEVAALRAERDGLRLEVESLRAKLAIAQEQLSSQSGIGDAVRELQTIVGRLAMSRPDLAGPPQPTTDVEEPVAAPAGSPIAVGPVVFPAAPVVDTGPDAPDPIVDLTVEAAPPTPAPDTRETSSEPSALEQLAAMGLWPPRSRDEATEDTSAFAPPAAVPSVDREPLPPRQTPPPQPPAEPVISWDPASSRTTPVAAEPTVGRVDVDEVPSERGRTMRILTKVGAGLGILAVVLIMAVTVGPRFLPYQTYFVRSGSMEPTIHVGAMVVLTKTDATKLEVGDIITFENPDKPGTLVTHRIVGVENGEAGRTFTTKGDANGSADSWRVPAQGDGWKYAFNVPLIGYVFGYLGTPQARLALLAVPAAILGVLSLLDIWSPAHRKTKKGRS